MSNTYKVTWQFYDASGDSWSEIFYAVANTPAELTAVPIGAANGRLNILAPTCVWQRIRVAQVGVPGTKSTATRVTGWSGTSSNTSGPAPAGSAVVVNLVGANGGSRKWWLRGCPQGLINRSNNTGYPQWGQGLVDSVNQIVQSLGAKGYGVRILVPAQKYPITSVISFTSAGQAVVTYAIPQGINNPNFVTGQNVVISQADPKTLAGLKGVFQIVNQVPGVSITVRYLVASSAGITQNCGFVKSQTYSAVSPFAASLSSLAYFGTHSTRSTFSNSRGARRAVRIRTLA